MIYVADTRACREADLLPFVCEKRKEYASKFRMEADRIRSLSAAVLLGIALKREGYYDDIAVELTHDEKGKPCLVLPDACENSDVSQKEDRSTPVYFSLSHAGDYVAVAVLTDPVGIDIETIRPCKDNLINRFFTQEERDYIRECAAGSTDEKEKEKDLAFTRIWTLKESFLKATGMGMQLGLETFSVTREPGNKDRSGKDPYAEGRFSYRQAFDRNTYTGQLLKAPDGYAFSVCRMCGQDKAEDHADNRLCFPADIHYVNLKE